MASALPPNQDSYDANPRRFTTGDALFASSFAITLIFPHSQSNWVYSSFLAALYNMGQSFAWITAGETTADEAAQVFRDLIDYGIQGVYFDIGDIKWTAVIPSASWLPCNGTTVNQADWPDLYAAIGTTFNTGGEPAGTFRLPDLRGRTLAGIDVGNVRLPDPWANNVGGTGGEATHTLTVGESASHSHTDTGHSHLYTSALANATTIGPGAPEPTAVPFPDLTASASANLTNTGGGGAHNNVQPTLIALAYIFASWNN